jgi:hypothetical protein
MLLARLRCPPELVYSLILLLDHEAGSLAFCHSSWAGVGWAAPTPKTPTCLVSYTALIGLQLQRGHYRVLL